MENKPREFWIKRVTELKRGHEVFESEIATTDRDFSDPMFADFKDAIHVIEKSALDAANLKIQELEAHIEALKGQLGYLPSKVMPADKYPQTIESNLLAESLMRKLEAAQTENERLAKQNETLKLEFVKLQQKFIPTNGA